MPKSNIRGSRNSRFKSQRRRKVERAGQIAIERVDILFQRALRVYKSDPGLANRYLDIAKRVRMVARVRLPERWRPYVCRGCGELILPSVNCRVRIQSRKGQGSRVVKTCLKCWHVTRYYIKRPRVKPA